MSNLEVRRAITFSMQNKTTNEEKGASCNTHCPQSSTYRPQQVLTKLLAGGWATVDFVAVSERVVGRPDFPCLLCSACSA